MVVKNKAIIQSAREILFDTYPEAYRWGDLMLLRFLYEGIQKLNMIRPESRYIGMDVVEIDIPDLIEAGDESEIKAQIEVAMGTDFPINSRWKDAIVHYICARAFQLDESDTMNASRYSEHMGLFTTWAKM